MSTNTFPWPHGQRCAVSLTYDDGLPVHYKRVGSLLESEGLRGTFYVPGLSDIRYHPERWRALAAAGHELGNHSLFHPCRQDPKDPHDWLPPHYDLRTYTPERWDQELELTNLILHLVDGKTERSYGNNCCNTTIGHGDAEIPMDDILRKHVVAGRGPFNDQIAIPPNVNLMQVGHFGGDEQSFDAIRTDIERACDTAMDEKCGATFPGAASTWPAVFEIDHIMERRVTFTAAKVVRGGGSDHHPVFARFVLKPPD